MTETPDDVSATVDKRIQQYVAVRDRIKALEEKHKEELKPFVEVQNMLTGWVQSFLDKTGVESVKTKHGTAYSSTRYSASLADADAFMNFVKTTSNYDLLDRRANVTAVKDYVAEHGNLPPGCNLTALKTIGVRRGPAKKDD